MSVDLRSALRIEALMGARRRTMPVAVLLVVLATLAAGIGGTAHFTGGRLGPHFGKSEPGEITGTIIPPVAQTGAVGGGFSLPSWLLLIGVALAAIAFAVVVFRLRPPREPPSPPEVVGPARQVTNTQLGTANMPQPEPDAEPEPEELLTGMELALAVLDQGGDPADAVVRAWLGLQETAEESGIVRRAAETPSEFTARIMRGAFVDDRAVRTLLRLYLRTRFGHHPVTAQDVEEARATLRQLVSSWRPAGGVQPR